MTLIEMTIAGMLVGVALFLLAGWMTGLRADARRDLCVRMLSELDAALVRYRRTTGSFPAARGQDSQIPVLVDLLDLEKTRTMLEALPAELWRSEGTTRMLVDPWGTPLRYVGPESKDARVAVNGGRPIFVSAGPDRDFGDESPDAAGNNLRSDDPGPKGFPIHDVFRDAFVDDDDGREQESGKEDNPGD